MRKFEQKIREALVKLNLNIDGRVTVILRDEKKGKTVILAEGKITPRPTPKVRVLKKVKLKKKPASLTNWLQS